MAVPFYSDRPGNSSPSPERPFTLHPTEEPVKAAEDCVQANPESAIWTTFAVGLALGAVLGWTVAQRRHERSWREKLSDLF